MSRSVPRRCADSMALYLVIHIGAFLSRIVPRRWRYLVGTAVGDTVYMVWARKRRILKQNTATVLGLDVRARQVAIHARKSMRNYCKYLIEFLELPTLSPDHEAVAGMKIHGLEHFVAALERGKGVIVATAHFGTIEVPGLRLLHFTDAFHAVYDSFKPKYLDDLIRRKRREKRIIPVPVSNVREMLRVLRQGGVLAMLFDKPVGAGRGVPVRFFGREAAVPAGPAVLAMKTGAAIVPVFTFRRPDLTFECVVFPPIPHPETGDRDRDSVSIMQKLMDALQTMVREHPDQWYMFRPMWPDAIRPRRSTGRRAAADGPPL